jgi:hypothetical protein
MTKAFEVRVQGELGEPMLRLLGWSHSTVPEQTLMRVEATPSDLHRLLKTCSERGLTIERVVRVGPLPEPPPRRHASR